MAGVGVLQIDAADLGNPRLREAILYALRAMEDDPVLGEVKLHAVLFFADASAHLSGGGTVTGAAYRRSPEGPSPDGGGEELRRLRREGAVVEVAVTPFDRRESRPRLKALRGPNLALLSPEATVHLDQAVAEAKRMTMAEALDVLRRMPVWRWADEGAALDFAFLDSPVRVGTQVDDATREAARASARRQGFL